MYSNDDRLLPKMYSKDAPSPTRKKIPFVEEHSVQECEAARDIKVETN